jgi:hypothetical protein
MPLTARQAIKLIIEAGGYFYEHGGAHDLYMLNGHKIPVPRHSGDLSSGVEGSIKRAIKKWK